MTIEEMKKVIKGQAEMIDSLSAKIGELTLNLEKEQQEIKRLRKEIEARKEGEMNRVRSLIAASRSKNEDFIRTIYGETDGAKILEK